jgi:subtilisin family serine protease
MLIPWAHRWGVYSTRGSLILKLALGHAPEEVPAWIDVRSGRRQPVHRIDVPSVDRALQHFSAGVEISRVHASARGLGVPGDRHRGFDETEQSIGLSRTFQVDVDDDCDLADLIDALRHLDIVENAYPHYLCSVPFQKSAALAETPNETDSWRPREMVRASEALAYEAGDPAVIVAVVDTGVLHDHVELHDRLRAGRNTVLLAPGDLPTGVRLLEKREMQRGDPEDIVGHGTSCAGIIRARGEGMPPGLAGECSCLPIRVLGAAVFPGKEAPVGIGAIADIDCGVKMAVDLGAKVLNMSFGTPESSLVGDTPPHLDVVRYALARGCILVAASGNSGLEEEFTPSSLDGVIAVGAVDLEGKPAHFSTRGPQVAICAPGVEIVSSGLHGYARVTGTSFAAPFVAAAAGLLVARAERRAFPIDGAIVRRVLRASARPWSREFADKGHGTGILDAAAALQELDREIDQT